MRRPLFTFNKSNILKANKFCNKKLVNLYRVFHIEMHEIKALKDHLKFQINYTQPDFS